MSDTIRRIFVEKKKPYAVEAANLCADLQQTLGLTNLKSVRIVNRYDLEGLDEKAYEEAKSLVLSEAPVDMVRDEELEIPAGVRSFAVELVPGQYDQRCEVLGVLDGEVATCMRVSEEA